MSKSERFSHALVQAIKKERENQKISQYSLAKLSGISQTMIHHMEGGKRNPTVITVHALAVALGLSMGELIERAEALLVNKRTEKL